MAGSRKGKNKKKKEKSNPPKSNANNKQTEISNFNSDMGHEKEGVRCDTKYFEDDEVEKLLYLKIEAAYKEACKIIWDLGYNIETAKKALLCGGLIVGERDILSSIMKSSLTLINSSRQIEGKVIFDKEPVFKDLPELIRFWVQTLVNIVEKKCPGLPKSCVMLQILSSKSLDTVRTHQTYPHKSEAYSSSEFSGDEFDFDELLNENVVALKNLNLTYTPQMASQSEMNATSSVIPQEHNQSSMQSNQDSSKAFEFDQSFKPLECFARCYDEISLNEWLRNSSGEQKDEMLLNLEYLIGSLEQQVDDRKEWAKKKEREAVERLNSDTLELNMLRLEKEEKEQKTKEKEELATSWNTKILKKEIDKRREIRQVGCINERVKKLEAEIIEIRADLTAVELNESESKRNLKYAMKKEKEGLKKIENSEKQISKAQGQINEEKQKILQLEEELKNIDQAQKEAKLKFKQELEEKEQARLLFLEEKRLTRIARENASRRLSSLQQELNMEHQRVMNHKMMLMEELSRLKISYYCSPNLSASGGSEAGSSQNFVEEMQIPDHRRCIVCFQKEVSVLFIPCAHQVVCFNCSASVGDSCPSCQVQIAKQYRVYGGRS